MDTFIDKLAQKRNAQEMIRANMTAEAAKMEQLQGQMKAYDELMQEIRKVNLKTAENTAEVRNVLKECMEKLETMQESGSQTEDNGEAVGFFCYSVNVEDNTGFLKFIIVDGRKRGAGYGKKMLQLAVRYAFLLTGAEPVGLNVFEENSAAKHCYESVGFIETSTKKDIFTYNNESWGRCRMTVGKPAKAGSYA